MINPHAGLKSPVEINGSLVFEFNQKVAAAQSTSNLFLENDSTLSTQYVPIGCMQNLAVGFYKEFAGWVPAHTIYLKIVANLESADPNRPNNVLFSAKYPVKVVNGSLNAIQGGIGMPLDLSYKMVSGYVQYPPPPPTQVLTKAWRKIEIKDYNLPYNGLSNQTFLAGEEINIYPSDDTTFDPNTFAIIPNLATETILNPGVLIEAGNPTQCNTMLQPISSDTLKTFCQSSTYKANRGFYFKDDPESLIEGNEESNLVNTKLGSAFPNPTNRQPVVNVPYQIGQAGAVRVYVSNMLGEQVAVLVDNSYHEMGMFHIDFDTTHLKAGIYYYTLETAQGKETKRLVVVK
jgi:hypothetical protein